MRKLIFFQFVLCFLLSACEPVQDNTPTSTGIESGKSSATSQKMKSLPTATSSTPETINDETPVPVPPSTISRTYSPIQLSPNLVDQSHVKWQSGDEIFVPYSLNIDRLPDQLVQKSSADGSFDLFADHPDYLNNGLLAIIALGEPEPFTFQDYVSGFDNNPQILSEGEFTTSGGVTGTRGILEHEDPNMLLIRAGFLSFQTKGHSYYIFFTTTASSFEQIDPRMASTLKSIAFIP